MIYDNNNGGEYGKYFVQELAEHARELGEPEFVKLYNKFAKRVLWMDSDVVPGAFQMNTAWYHSVPERDPIFTEHSHPYDELIGFYGSDKDDPYNLNGVIEFAINGEPHRLTRSTMIFLPGGFSHNPMRILEVNKPIFHFSIVMNNDYDGDATYR
ncbi:MAG: hypothetical protein LBC65_04835 [Oscillospiraceae bacterium]|jgi:hypothetical protein|nr:hypothetical protein [Oscillospiraceae bacterium]